jgi:Fuc2NAc and GlcNAc transferase
MVPRSADDVNAAAAVVIAAGLVTFAGTLVVRRYALAHQLLDFPGDRSSHETPTPRGGGLAIAVTTLGAFAAAGCAGWLPPQTALAFVAGGSAVAVVGWIDDHGGVAPLARVLVHLCAATFAVALLRGFPSADLGFGPVRLGLVGSVVAVLGIGWAVNFFNFMDGIDGIAGLEAVTVGLAGGALLWTAGQPGLAWAGFVVAAASLGFLVWNWAPARIFMGDVGSGLLGFYFGVLAVASENSGATPASVWGLLLGVFVVDATVTLGRRLLRGERVYEAHRKHAYQRLCLVGLSHRSVCLGVLGLNLGLAVLAALAVRRPALLLAVLVGGALLLGVVYFVVERLSPFDVQVVARR